ncbi:hypothetical protein VTI74DRAFT_6599 [Chaetomium olivicolor]
MPKPESNLLFSLQCPKPKYPKSRQAPGVPAVMLPTRYLMFSLTYQDTYSSEVSLHPTNSRLAECSITDKGGQLGEHQQQPGAWCTCPKAILDFGKNHSLRPKPSVGQQRQVYIGNFSQVHTLSNLPTIQTTSMPMYLGSFRLCHAQHSMILIPALFGT